MIGPAEQRTFFERDPHNFVRLELPLREGGSSSGTQMYRTAAETYDRWLADGVLHQDRSPSLYAYRQRFGGDNGPQERCGIVGALRIEPWERRTIRPHERTLEGPKRDRLDLMRACQANLSPIWGLYADATGASGRMWASLADRAPEVEATDMEGVRHDLWVVAEPGLLGDFTQALSGTHCYIADGHHRYETARHYEAEHCDGAECTDDSAAHFTMAYLVDVSDPGLVVFGTHRLIRSSPPPTAEAIRGTLNAAFDLVDLPNASVSALIETLDKERRNPGFAVWAPSLDIALLAYLREPEVPADLAAGRSTAWRRLDLAALHVLGIDRIYPEGTTALSESGRLMYSRSLSEVDRVLETNEAQVAFLVRKTLVNQVTAVADAGDLMPEKSTYFYPKPLSGIVVASLKGEVSPA